MAQMRMAVVEAAGGPEVIHIRRVAVPEPSEGQVRIRVAYAALNPLDAHARAARIKWNHPGFPFTPGFEFSGLVNAVGQGIEKSWVGRRVASNAAWGGNAEFVLVPADGLVPIPDQFSWKLGTVFSTCAYTAWLLIHSAAKARVGQSIAIHSAAGAVGVLTTQIAKSAGLTVFGLAGGESKLNYARQFGADHLIDYRQDNWPEQVKELNNGRGVDFIIDGNAGPSAPKNLDAIAPLGLIIYIGAMAGQAPDVNISTLIGKSCGITGFVQYFHQAKIGPSAFDELHQKLESGSWRIPIERVFELEELAEAHRAFEARELFGRTLIKLSGEL